MSDTLAAARGYVESTAARLLKTLGEVPDDKLNWQPSPTSKSALRIAAHAAVSLKFLSGVVRGEAHFPASMAEAEAAGGDAEAAITSREALAAALADSTADAVAAIGALSPEQLQEDVVTPFMTAPLAFFVNLLGRHTDNHAAQIDYLQTVWGDHVFHI